MKRTLILTSILAVAASFSGGNLRAQTTGNIQAYASAPGASTAFYTTAQVETFTEFTTGGFTTLTSTATNPNSFTYTSGGTTAPLPGINAQDLYAASTNTGQYLNITPGNTVTLTLGTAVPYFGIALSAVDAGNSFTFKDAAGNTIGTFNASIIRNLLPNTAGTTIKAINGTNYSTQSYYGQPGSGNNGGEIYSYLHFFSTTPIKSIVFQQNPGGNFENDNHSVLSVAPAVDRSFIIVPEPGVGMMVAAGCAGLLTLGRLRRSKR